MTEIKNDQIILILKLSLEITKHARHLAWIKDNIQQAEEFNVSTEDIENKESSIFTTLDLLDKENKETVKQILISLEALEMLRNEILNHGE